MLHMQVHSSNGLLLAVRLQELLMAKDIEIAASGEAGSLSQVKKLLADYRAFLDPCRGEVLREVTQFLSDGRSHTQIHLRREFMMSPAQRMLLLDEVHRQVTRVIEPGMSEDRRLKAIVRWLSRRINYRNTGHLSDHNPFVGFFGGYGVCQSIALVAQYMFRAAGIPALYISGRRRDAGSQDPSHAWNLVKVEGNWYHVDCTRYAGLFLLPHFQPLIPWDVRAQEYSWDTSTYSLQACEMAARYLGSLPYSVLSFPGGSVLQADDVRMVCEAPPMLTAAQGQPCLWADLMALLTENVCERKGDFINFRGRGGSVNLRVDGVHAILHEGRCYIPALLLSPVLHCKRVGSTLQFAPREPGQAHTA